MQLFLEATVGFSELFKYKSFAIFVINRVRCTIEMKILSI